jgi:hypothetical protein
MDCCGHGHVLTRRCWMRSTQMSVAAMVGGGLEPRGSTAAAQNAETDAAGLDVLRNSISVDVHTHGGTTGITSTAPPNDELAKSMRAGSSPALRMYRTLPILARNEAGVDAGTGRFYKYYRRVDLATRDQFEQALFRAYLR